MAYRSVMHKLEIVNSDTHKNTKVSLHGALAKNDNVHMSHIMLYEFAEIAQYYPIFFSKDNVTGQFQPVALFGLAIDENIYQAAGLWHKCYLPQKIQSQPFYVIDDESQDEHDPKPCLVIDVEDPRVQEAQGEALFINGKATQYLQQQTTMLSDMTKGFISNSAFISALLAHNYT